jgi:nucleotide-binding universal stress UspA family protein
VNGSVGFLLEPSMIDISRILCPVDFSDASRHAIEHAVAVARWYQARIIALHVAQPPPPVQPPFFVAAFAVEGAPIVPTRQELEEQLRAWLEPAHRAGLKTDVVVDSGKPALCIVERARSEHADLIVMGTHGTSGFERFMVGSVAENVLRRAPCPVMTVPPRAATSAKVPYTRLLCPVDFSESSLSALRFASSLAEEGDARLTILHVLYWTADEEMLVERFDVGQFHHVMEEQAAKRLDELVTEDMRTWCKPESKIAFGKPYAEILRTAEAEASDLIVIGIRGRNPLDMAFFGSTTNHVVRRASCPVLTLR